MIDSSKWFIEHLLQAEVTDRHMRSVRNQLNAAKFPVHRDLAKFDFDAFKVDRPLVKQDSGTQLPYGRWCFLLVSGCTPSDRNAASKRHYQSGNRYRPLGYLLVEAGVAVVPGSAFCSEGYIRLSFATSMNNLEKAIERIANALK